jgi:hypothetical protein
VESVNAGRQPLSTEVAAAFSKGVLCQTGLPHWKNFGTISELAGIFRKEGGSVTGRLFCSRRKVPQLKSQPLCSDASD